MNINYWLNLTPPSRRYALYIFTKRQKNKSLYIGYSNNVEQRLKHHRELGVPYYVIPDTKLDKDSKCPFFDAIKEKWYKLTSKEITDYISKRA